MWAYALVIASEARGFFGFIKEAVGLADEAIEVLTKMLQGYTLVGKNMENLPEPVILLVRAFHSKNTAELSDIVYWKSLDTVDRERTQARLKDLCAKYGLHLPPAHASLSNQGSLNHYAMPEGTDLHAVHNDVSNQMSPWRPPFPQHQIGGHTPLSSCTPWKLSSKAWVNSWHGIHIGAGC